MSYIQFTQAQKSVILTLFKYFKQAIHIICHNSLTQKNTEHAKLAEQQDLPSQVTRDMYQITFHKTHLPAQKKILSFNFTVSFILQSFRLFSVSYNFSLTINIHTHTRLPFSGTTQVSW